MGQNVIIWFSRAGAYVTGIGVKKNLSLTFYKNVLPAQRRLIVFAYLCLLFVDLMQIPRNEFACTLQGTL